MRHGEVVRRTAAGALLPLALASLTACADDGPSSRGPSSPSAASGTSSPTQSPSPAGEQPEAGRSLDPQAFLDVLRGALDRATTAHTTMSMTGSGLSMESEGDVDYSSDPPAVAMTLDGQGMIGHAEVRMVDGVLFLKLAMLGSKWVRMDLSDPSNPLGPSFGEAFDLHAVLRNFQAAIRDARDLGKDDVDGESLHRYRVTMDPAALADGADSSAPTPSDVPEEVSYDLWFDGDGLLRQMRSELGPDAGAVTLRLSDWGEHVAVEAPPADDVTELPGSSPG